MEKSIKSIHNVKYIYFIYICKNIYIYTHIRIYVHTMFQSGEGNGTPLQYSCLENPMDGGAW